MQLGSDLVENSSIENIPGTPYRIPGLRFFHPDRIGEWLGGPDGAVTGRLVGPIINLTWLIPSLILCAPDLSQPLLRDPRG